MELLGILYAPRKKEKGGPLTASLPELQEQRSLAAEMVRDLVAKIPGTPDRQLSEDAIGSLGIMIGALEKTIARLDSEIAALKNAQPTN